MNERRPIRLLICGGGTGGHLFPAVAAAQEFQRRYPDTQVLFIGTKRKVDTRSLQTYGFASASLRSYGFKGKNPFELLKALFFLPISIILAAGSIRRFGPDILLGVGGYVTVPVVVAGRILGVPVVIHEQNSIPGLANRKLGRIADRICLSLPGSEVFFGREKVHFTGNPVRRNILDLKERPPRPTGRTKTWLIIGGSQGARGVNRLVKEATTILHRQNRLPGHIIHQTGEGDSEAMTAHYRDLGVSAQVRPFFTDMAEIYRQADIIVSRAGATALAEIAVLGIPAILIPYPYAADNHQEQNGRYYVDGGGAVMYRQNDLDGAKLAEVVYTLLADNERLAAMGAAMKNLAYPDAPQRIVECCLEAMKAKDV